MSFVVATPGLVESAAQDLAGIRSSLADVAATVAGPTTGIASAAQDEVSVAIASLFGNFGEEFQTLNAAAQSFHAQFVSLMSSGAGAYVSAETANAAQTVLGGGFSLGNVGQTLGGALTSGEAAVGQLAGNLGVALNGGVGLSGSIQAELGALSNAVTNAPAALSGAIQTSLTNAQGAFTALQTGGTPALINSLNEFGATVAAPYQALISNTTANLQAIGNTVMANPLPVLHQFLNNQVFLGQQLASQIQNLPTELANLPADIQAALQNFQPGALLQQFVNNQVGFAQTVGHALTSVPGDFVTGLQGLPAAFQTGAQDLLAGNWTGAVTAIGKGVEGVFLPGFADITLPLSPTPPALPIVPLGVLGDLAPLFSIPGQMAQNFTNLLPLGSIPQLMAQNATNLISSLTNFGATINGLFTAPNLALNFGVPLQFLFDAIGAPATTISAFGSSVTTFANALTAGDATGAVAAILDAPAVLANGFLNGTTLLPLPPLSVALGGPPGLITNATIPLGGLLTPLGPVVTDILGPLPGSEFGGFIPGLLSIGEQLAQSIALPAPSLPSFLF